MVHILGFQFYWYGLILGFSIWVGWTLILRQAQWRHFPTSVIEALLPWVIIGGVVGARVYHVLTDWSVYQAHPITAVYIWQGGLSVIGAVIGGSLVMAWLLHRWGKIDQLVSLLDLSVFGLPWAQVIGRLGNYVNQELYGRPSMLPWAIKIDPQYRIAGYEAFSTFHPLFAYEMLAMAGYGVVVWWLSASHKGPPLGSGLWFASYAVYYAVVRFSLDFLRIDTRYIGYTGITVNQVVMLLVLVTALIFIRKQYVTKKA